VKYLIVCKGFIGDVLFASSIAKKLKIDHNVTVVDYLIPVKQPKLLLNNNPFIDYAFDESDHMAIDYSSYDKIVHLSEINQAYPATYQYQVAAGISNPTLEFNIYTSPLHDIDAMAKIDYIRKQLPKNGKVIAWQKNWEWKAYQTTDALLQQGKGGPHRNIEQIIYWLGRHEEIALLPMGFDRHVNTTDGAAQNPELYSQTASLIKYCDWMIGSEGGLTNLAAGIGTKCIITTDFIFQNYGPLGLVRPTEYPAMGPAVYYPDAGHVHLHYELTDREVYQLIYETISNV